MAFDRLPEYSFYAQEFCLLSSIGVNENNKYQNQDWENHLHNTLLSIQLN